MAATGIVQAKRSAHFVTVPVDGGVYREGVVASSPKEREVLVDGLTKVGFVSRALDGSIEPAVARAWEVTADAQTVRLALVPKVHADDVKQVLAAQTDAGYWKDAEVVVVDQGTLEFHLPRPWASFLEELMVPVFPYGPYTLLKNDADTDTLLFGVNDNALQKPHMSRIEVSLYPDTHSLDRALRKNAVDGIYLGEVTDAVRFPGTWKTEELPLDREHVLFFNTKQEVFASADVRKKLARNESVGNPITIRLATPDIETIAAIADDLKARWEPLGVTVDVTKYPTLALTKNVIPNRDYDAILLGIDYGYDGDPFPYWHSSQIAAPGLNLAGYRNKDVDKLLEEARTIVDAGERHTRYQRALQIVADDAAMISFGSPKVLFAHAPKIKGEVPKTLELTTDRWAAISEWYIKEKRVKQTS